MPRVEVPAEEVFSVLKKNILVDGFHVVIDLEKSHGAVIVDARDGKEYLDCYGYFATLPVGHRHPKLRDEGFRESLMTAALSNPSNSDMYSREFAAFVKSFRDLAVPAEFRYLSFVAGGGLAVENTMKAAFDWKAQKNRARGVVGGADKILHFRDAFHGRTGYTLSVTNTDPTKTDDFPQFDWPRISSPYIDFPMDEEAVAAKEEVACAEIESAFEHDPDGIAAILVEPIQAEGGDHHFRPEFFAKLREYSDRYEVLLIFDEVQTGLGSTGTMWAYEQSGVVPDLIAFGKKTQVCGMMSTRRIDEIGSNVFHVSGRINSTWGGNLTDMIRCVRYLEIIHEDRLLENATLVGATLKQGLEILAGECEIISNVRGKGLLVAFDLPDGVVRGLVVQACWDRGLAVLSCGPQSIRLRPPLVFSEPQATLVLGTLREVVNSL